MLTKEFLINRGVCCGNKCINCPYRPRHRKGSSKLMPDDIFERLRKADMELKAMEIAKKLDQ